MISTLQTSLDTFLEASQQAILNLSPKKGSRKPKTFESRFRELPVEIRCMIYKHIFEKARLRIGRSVLGYSLVRTESFPVDEILKSIEHNQAAILSAFQWCRQEALEILAQHTTLYFGEYLDPNNNIRDDLLAFIDKTFLQHVTRIEMPLVNFLRANLALLPRLKEVRLLHWLCDGITFSRDSVHIMLCQHCGDPSCSKIWSMIEGDIIDWKWKRNQLLYLAAEHNWQLRYVCQWVSVSSRMDIEIVHDAFEVEFSPCNQQVISMWTFPRTKSGTREYIKLKNVEQVIKLGLFAGSDEFRELRRIELC